MNYRFENKHSRKENAPENIKSTTHHINANVGVDENVKTRSRSGGYVAWPEREQQGNAKRKRKPGAPQ